MKNTKLKGFLLTVLLGPIGLLYIKTNEAIVLIILGLLSLLTLQLLAPIAIIIWMISVAIATFEVVKCYNLQRHKQTCF